MNVLPSLPQESGNNDPKTLSLVSPASSQFNNGSKNVLRSKREDGSGNNSDDVHTNQTVTSSVELKKLKIDCSSNHIMCIEVTCTIGPFGSKTQTIASFEFDSALNLSVMKEGFGTNYSSIELSIDFEGEIIDEIDSTITKSSTKLIANFKQQSNINDSVQTWVFIVSSGAGLFILTLVIICLISVSNGNDLRIEFLTQ